MNDPRLAAAAAILASAAAPPSIALGQGADVSLCDIPQVTRWGTADGITAYSIGTAPVNVGSVSLDWIQNGMSHPVIGQNMYRILNGRIEQIGQSWVRHTSCALQLGGNCDSGCPNQGGCQSFLAPGCQDSNTAGGNGAQVQMGPKWQVNPDTGQFSWPYAGLGQSGDVLYKRLQVHNEDLANAGAVYLVEGQYVALDDATAGNQNNNNSYRLVSIGAGPDYFIGFIGGHPTQFQRDAMNAWVSHGLGQGIPDPSVTLVNASAPPDGRFVVGTRYSDNGDGTWHYEYVVQNINNHRAARQFIVPIGEGAVITNIGFHDVDYHSGDGEGAVTFDGTDWVVTEGAGSVSWSTSTHAASPNANALRWGTMYNFRFDANTEPTQVDATIGLFKPGAPETITVGVRGPGPAPVNPCPWDLSGNGEVDVADLTALILGWGPVPPGDPAADFNGDGDINVSDMTALILVWGPCPPAAVCPGPKR